MTTKKEFCLKHKVDHYGTWCGACVIQWQINSNKLKKVRKAFKEVEAWINLDIAPFDHPLRGIKRALK